MILFTRGAFSFVYKAKDTVTNQEVAIKVVRKRELDASEVIIKLFIQFYSIIFIVSYHFK
jgi:serine/threonine protein kinase